MSGDDSPSGAAPWVPVRPSLTSIRDALPECRGCDLYRDAIQAVPGRGPARARLMLLGEQPGDQEDQQGEPFVGPAGRVLDRALAEAGIDPDTTYTTNVVKHFRWQGHRGKQRLHKSPTRWQVTACGPWLVAELDVVRPQGVVLLGGTAGKALYGAGFRVSKARGRLEPWPDSMPVTRVPDWVLATTHPSAALRAEDRDAVFAGLVADLRVAAGALT